MKLIYCDTSVYGGKFDAEFEFWTDLFFQEVSKRKIQIVFSNVVEDELKNAPIDVRNFVINLPKQLVLQTQLTEEAVSLAEQYLKENVVGKASRTDCYHIAIATIMKVDLLVSWNFKHIVNIRRIKGYNAVNLKNDYPIIEIRNPREIFDYED